MVELARTLGLDVVAEGVETEGQRRALAELDCGSAQGYLFARPEPADQAGAALTDRREPATVPLPAQSGLPAIDRRGGIPAR
jgi:EAL domain-containing protein (putative c-di-GMP-specific phosphodiesterase class I)